MHGVCGFMGFFHLRTNSTATLHLIVCLTEQKLTREQISADTCQSRRSPLSGSFTPFEYERKRRWKPQRIWNPDLNIETPDASTPQRRAVLLLEGQSLSPCVKLKCPGVKHSSSSSSLAVRYSQKEHQQNVNWSVFLACLADRPVFSLFVLLWKAGRWSQTQDWKIIRHTTPQSLQLLVALKGNISLQLFIWRSFVSPKTTRCPETSLSVLAVLQAWFSCWSVLYISHHPLLYFETNMLTQ